MAIPGSGPISLNTIAGEFGGSTPHSINEYYRNGGRVPSNNTNVPTSGQISFSNFYGAQNSVTVNASNSGSRVYASNYFGSNWGSSVPKILVIPSNVTLGSSNTGQEALQINSGMGGTLTVLVQGSVQGASGGGNSGTGGNAIYCVQTSGVTINVTGSVLAGGGGGGRGGTGGKGGNGYYTTTSTNSNGSAGPTPMATASANCNTLCSNTYGGGSFCNGSCTIADYNRENKNVTCSNCAYTATNTTYTTGGNGGGGGNGGRGQGYGLGNTVGSGGAGGANGGTNAGKGGTGGTGGNGATWGSYGNTGNTGASGNNGNNGSGSGGSSGSGGAAPGYYIVNRGSITLINNGTCLGR